MSGKQHLRFIRSLEKKKIRQQEQLFVAEGAKIVPELIREKYPIHEIIALEEWAVYNTQLLQGTKIKVTVVNENEMKLASQMISPQPVLAVCSVPPEKEAKLDSQNITLYLDSIRDPGNLGTIIRLADWFGLKQLWYSPDSVDWTNPKVIQSSMGSFMRIEMVEVERTLLQSHIEINTPIYAADLGGENIYTSKLSNHGVIVLGNEANGLSDEIKSLISRRINIPTFSNNEYHAESLNVSIAAALILGEFKRRTIE